MGSDSRRGQSSQGMVHLVLVLVLKLSFMIIRVLQVGVGVGRVQAEPHSDGGFPKRSGTADWLQRDLGLDPAILMGCGALTREFIYTVSSVCTLTCRLVGTFRELVFLKCQARSQHSVSAGTGNTCGFLS